MIADVKFDFERAESLRIYPKKQRPNIATIPLSSQERVVRRALEKCEKELKFIMDVANDRADDIKALVEENTKAGHHLIDSPFIPEYLGFIEVAVDKEDFSTLRIYSREGFNITRIDDRWLVYCPNEQRPVVKINNLYEAIIVLSALGMNLNFQDYFDGKYSLEKPLEEIIDSVIVKVIGERLAKEAGPILIENKNTEEN